MASQKMLIELQRIPYSTQGMETMDSWLDWDSKNLNPLRDLLHKAENELGEITNPYDGLLTEAEKEKYKKDLEEEETILKNREENQDTELIRNHIAYYKERLQTGKDGFQLGKNRGFSTFSLKELKELREKVPNKYAFDVRLRKLIEIELEWEKRHNGIKELPDEWSGLNLFQVDEWIKQMGVKMQTIYTNCPITLMIYGQNKQPEEFKELDNETFIDENGLELWSWCNPLKEGGRVKQCHSYHYYTADEKYLILLTQGSTTEHKWKKEDCVADYGGSWGWGGCIQQYQDLGIVEQQYKEENEGKSYSCTKGFAKIFMTQRAWAVAKLMKERNIYIPKSDFADYKTIKEKADKSIEQLNDYYLFMYPERGENNSHHACLDLKFWIVKAYSEERFNQEYEKAKQKNLPKCFNDIEINLSGEYGSLKTYLEYKEKDSKYAQSWLKISFERYKNLSRIAGEMGKSIKPLKEYQEEVRERVKQQLAEKLKSDYGSEMAKEVLLELVES